MKAVFKHSENESKSMELTPETEDDARVLGVIGTELDRAHMIRCRGFDYMKSTVSFLIQPISRGD